MARVCREVAALFVAGSQLQRGDDFAVALKLWRWKLARLASIDTSDRLGASVLPKLPIERGAGNAVESGSVLQERCAIRMPGQQRVEAAAQVDQRLGGNPLAAAPQPLARARAR
jgi:hypothetical protein